MGSAVLSRTAQAPVPSRVIACHVSRFTSDSSEPSSAATG